MQQPCILLVFFMTVVCLSVLLFAGLRSLPVQVCTRIATLCLASLGPNKQLIASEQAEQ